MDGKIDQKVWETIDRFKAITPEKEFGLLGIEPKFEMIKHREK